MSIDDNTRDVLLAAIPVFGTVIAGLGGIFLGRWLENRHRHDEERRRSYGQYAAAIRSMILAMEFTPRDGADVDRMIREGTESRAMVDLVGGKRALAASARITEAMGAWLGGPAKDADPDAWDAGRAAVEDRLTDFLDAGRKDLA